jgi:Fur family transcriptional regulator, ferric uptake regulator
MGVQADFDWAGHARAVLQKAGHQRGGAREEMIDLLARQDCALSAAEIEDALKGGERAVGRASVYRVLELLLDHGLVNRLELGDGVARYELVDPAGTHHHHMLCERCGQLVPFHDGGLERSIELLSQRLGFRTDDHEVVLRGSCSDCR